MLCCVVRYVGRSEVSSSRDEGARGRVEQSGRIHGRSTLPGQEGLAADQASANSAWRLLLWSISSYQTFPYAQVRLHHYHHIYFYIYFLSWLCYFFLIIILALWFLLTDWLDYLEYIYNFNSLRPLTMVVAAIGAGNCWFKTFGLSF